MQPKSTKSTPNRRQFLGLSAGLAVTATGVAQRSSPKPTRASQNASQPTTLGLIGCGRRGMQLLQAALKCPGVAFSIICDVDIARGKAAAEIAARISGIRPTLTVDYLDVIENPQAVGIIIATPDHWHAIPFMAACAAGKDVYIEVPLAPTVNEAAAMTYAARKYKRVVQVGFQQRSSSTFAEAGGILRSGTMGRIAQTRTWSFVRQSPIAREPDGNPPSTLEYDRWLGPAPQRPYNPVRVRDPQHFWDYGSGEATAWNIHLQDLVHSAMRVTIPNSVVAVGGNFGLNDERETPDTLDVLLDYSAPHANFTQAYSLRLSNAYAGWGPAALPPLPEMPDASPLELPGRSGVQFFGSEKTLYVSGKRLLILPAEADSPLEDLQYLGIGSSRDIASRPATDASTVDPLTVAHVRQFIDCINTRKEPSAAIDLAEIAQFACTAANIAYRVGRKLYIHPDKREFYTDPQHTKPDEEANKLRIRPYRAPYSLPAV